MCIMCVLSDLCHEEGGRACLAKLWKASVEHQHTQVQHCSFMLHPPQVVALHSVSICPIRESDVRVWLARLSSHRRWMISCMGLLARHGKPRSCRL